MTTSVSTKGHIVLPVEIRTLDEIEAGQQFEVERWERGTYRLARIDPPANAGLMEWLLACPVKDSFIPIESVSTAELGIGIDRNHR